MAVSLRLAKFGKKNAPTYRVVAIRQRSSRSGRAIEILGSFNPAQNKNRMNLNRERITYWQKQGAIVTDAVKKLVAGNYTYRKYNPGESKAKA